MQWARIVGVKAAGKRTSEPLLSALGIGYAKYATVSYANAREEGEHKLHN